MAGTITALVAQKKNPDRVNVYLDGRFAFGLATIEAARLRRGQTLSDDEIAALQNRDEVQKAHESALHYLDYRPRSVDEIRRYLKGKDVAPEVMNEIIERLTSVGLLDDWAFARYWLENRSDFRPRGERALRLELRQKGVPGDIVAEVREREPALLDAVFEWLADQMESKHGLIVHVEVRGQANSADS